MFMFTCTHGLGWPITFTFTCTHRHCTRIMWGWGLGGLGVGLGLGAARELAQNLKCPGQSRVK